MKPALAAAAPLSLEGKRAVEEFLFHEARLLDERRWDDWLQLFTSDGMYWVPLERGQTDPVNHASLFYENAMLRELRARRVENRRAWSQQPMTRAARLVGNVVVERGDGEALIARSTLHMMEWRRDAMRPIAGHVTHHLVPAGGSFLMRLKRIDLINCEAAHDAFEVFI
jgi:benzoate/toluate 1,2-dioxygenase beta subunit